MKNEENMIFNENLLLIGLICKAASDLLISSSPRELNPALKQALQTLNKQYTPSPKPTTS